MQQYSLVLLVLGQDPAARRDIIALHQVAHLQAALCHDLLGKINLATYHSKMEISSTLAQSHTKRDTHRIRNKIRIVTKSDIQLS